MLRSLCNIVLLALASLRVNATILTALINISDAASSPAVDVAVVDQVHTIYRSALDDTVGGSQNPTEESRTGIEEALKTYRQLAEKEPKTYLPNIAATLNDLGILDTDENRIEKARKEFEEALKTYRQLAHKEPDVYLRYVAITLNNLGVLRAPGADWRRR